MKRIYHQTPESAPARPGSRLAARLVGEMQLAGATDVIRVLEDHLGARVGIDRAMFLLMILREGARFRQSSTGVASHPAHGAEGISINAVAMSLERPFETVRRNVNGLIADGLCQRTAGGIVVSPEVLLLPPFVALLRMLHDRLVALVEDLARFGLAVSPPRVERAYDPDATIAATIDLILAPFEYVGDRFRNWLELVTVNAVIIVSTRGVGHDPVLARRYADAHTVPPEALRQPITISALARGLRMSDSTVRREIEGAIASGKLKRVAGGVLATDAFLADVTIARGGQLAAERTAQVLRRLAPGGFRFDDPARCYLDGRPPAISLA